MGRILIDIFVFGSNLAGRHGKGAALTAVREHGAIRGNGEGPQGRAYAIPTKYSNLEIIPLNAIAFSIGKFVRYAKQHPELQFIVTRIGRGLAGYSDKEIAPMFEYAPSNCQFDTKWSEYLPQRRYWGTK